MRAAYTLGAVSLLALGLHSAAFGYSATAAVTVAFGGSAAGANADATWSSADLGLTAAGDNALSALSNSTYFSTLSGYNLRSYYNADFATTSQCATLVAAAGGINPVTRKYACRYDTYGYAATGQIATPVVDAGPNGLASGTLTVTDTTLTGTLAIVSSTDEPTGGTSGSVGNGSNGYNYRSFDLSALANNWNGVTTAGTMAVSLTGTFTNSTWSITGGTVAFTDSGFGCQQGGFSSPDNIFCVGLGGAEYAGFQSDGAHLSWGVDADGAGTGSGISQIEVYNAAGTSIIATLSGVLASLTIDGSGNISTVTGEFRRVGPVTDFFSGTGGCGGGAAAIRYNGSKITCGALTAGALAISGTATEIPVPTAVWLFGSAIGLLGWLKRKAT
jgi:hypothetical protein